MNTTPPRRSFFHRLADLLGWNRSSYTLMSLFLAIIGLILIVWWPLVEAYFATADPNYPLWVQMDGLLLGLFAFMSLMIMAGANLKYDAWVALVGIVGGLVIESWGTQTLLWSYYTAERPPLWIIPAWPIASLAIDRMVRVLDRLLPSTRRIPFRLIYWIVFPAFLAIMLPFVWPTIDKSLTWMALLVCVLLTLTPTDHRLAVLTFAAGAGLGYFLERWGTTRVCWIYYTLQTPPLFAVLAHGLAAVAFWRTRLLFGQLFGRILRRSLGRFWPAPSAETVSAESASTASATAASAAAQD